MKISIQGYRGSFHHIVATRIWGDSIEITERSSFTDVFQDVINDKVEYGLVAIENTLAGSITETLDLLTTYRINIVGEYVLKVEQNLIVVPGTKLSDLCIVYSHPAAILQCLDFFKQYPAIKLIATDDTGGSVKQIVEQGDKSNGSIASFLAAKIYGGEVLMANIQSDKNNFTRFLIICHPDTDSKKCANLIARHDKNRLRYDRKVTIILNLEHKPGSLANCLNVIAKHKINITRIESRPIKGLPWEYTIHLDLLLPHPNILSELATELEMFATKVNIKGIYLPAIGSVASQE